MKSVGKLNNIFVTFQRILAKKFEQKKISNELNASDIELLKELSKVQIRLEQARVIFDSQTDLDLIESIIYDIGSLETRYNYLIKEARRKQIKCEVVPVCLSN